MGASTPSSAWCASSASSSREAEPDKRGAVPPRDGGTASGQEGTRDTSSDTLASGDIVEVPTGRCITADQRVVHVMGRIGLEPTTLGLRGLRAEYRSAHSCPGSPAIGGVPRRDATLGLPLSAVGSVDLWL